MAAIVALEALNRPCEVDLYSDSKYLTDAFNQHWIDNWVKNNWKRGKSGPVKNIDLWERLLKAKPAHRVEFHLGKGPCPAIRRMSGATSWPPRRQMETTFLQMTAWMPDPRSNLISCRNC